MMSTPHTDINASNSSEEEETWSTGYIVDRVTEEIAGVELSSDPEINSKTDLLEPISMENREKNLLLDRRKYYNQAYHHLKIGCFRPAPKFLISLSDLSPKLLKELAELDLYDRKFVLKQAVMRIFEDINVQLCHNSISKVLQVGLVE